MGIIQAIFVFLRAFIIGRAAAAAEILALRQQLAVCRQSIKRPKLRPRDRIFWVMLSCLWPDWRSALAIVQPETVIRWHRQGFKLYWNRNRIKDMDIEEVLIAPHSPWQNPYCERVIGSIRRDCLNRLIVLNERHWYRILTDYFDYNHNSVRSPPEMPLKQGV